MAKKNYDDDIWKDILGDEDDLMLLDPEDGTFANPKQTAKKSAAKKETASASTKKKDTGHGTSDKKNTGKGKNQGKAKAKEPEKQKSGKGGKIFLVILIILVVGVAVVLGVMQATGGNPFGKNGNAEPTPVVSEEATSSAEPEESEEPSIPVEDDVDITEESPATSEEPAESEQPEESESAEPSTWSGEGLAVSQLLADGYEQKLVMVDNLGVVQADGNHQVDSTMVDDLKAFIAAAHAQGYSTMLSTCYRDEVSDTDALDVQEHGTGLVVDFVDVTAQVKESFAKECTEQIAWLAENAAEYGFVVRFPEGKEDLTGESYVPYHFLYVGKSVAKDMADNGWCLEEYLAQ